MSYQSQLKVGLFDEIERNDVRPKRDSQPAFAYLNSSARPPFEIMRSILDGWFSRFPDLAKGDLRKGFRSTTDSDHRSAFLELYLHELLACMGYRLEVHPELQGTHKHPDYVVVGQQRPLFYLEATLALPSRGEQAADARAAQVYDSINDMESPNFFVAITIRGAPATPPPGRKLADALSRWLGGLDPDRLGKAFSDSGFDALPSFRWSHDGWDLSFLPVAKSPELRGRPGVRPIGISMPDEARIVESHRAIRSAVCSKATRYGELDLPFLIVVNAIAEHIDTIDTMNALFAEEFIKVRMNPGSSTSQALRRKKDGAWFGPTGPRNTRVSGAVVFNDLGEWTIPQNPVLVHNPYATKPFPSELWRLPQLAPDEGKARLVDLPGVDVVDLLNLPQPWPPTDNPLGTSLPRNTTKASPTRE